MDVQKQVSPGSVQFTATMSTPSRREAYRELPRPLPSTWSWIWIARRSHGRTPKNASRDGATSSVPNSGAPSARLADHSFSRGGCRNCFHEPGPAE